MDAPLFLPLRAPGRYALGDHESACWTKGVHKASAGRQFPALSGLFVYALFTVPGHGKAVCRCLGSTNPDFAPGRRIPGTGMAGNGRR
jgi:hypothetical protein